MTDAPDTMDITELLAAVQNSLNDAMKSIQAAVMRLETMEQVADEQVSNTLAVLRDTHRLLFRLDLEIVKAASREEVSA